MLGLVAFAGLSGNLLLIRAIFYAFTKSGLPSAGMIPVRSLSLLANP